MASDGKVIISTELDNSGFEKGIRVISDQLGGLGNTLKNIATMLAAAFSAKKITEFMAESSRAAMELTDALTGLRSILEGQGRSFSEAEAFIEEYTQDGLIPATNAINAYKNLASRGYDDSQIKQVMNALKDASAFGRQASMSMGEAVESATEGLKNENSILVDNAGVTKNVARMWDEYAASIGTTANNLTQQQKNQAEVLGILEATKYQTGDAATVAGTLSGQLLQLSFNFNNLKVAVGNAINPFVQTVLPIINSVIIAFTRLANAVATVVGILFGKATVQTAALAEQNDSVASSASAGAEAEKKLADNTKAAGKAAKKALASFDELNILQFGGGGDAAAKGPDTGTSSSGNTSGIEVEDTISPKLQAVADKIRELIAPLQQIDFTPAVEAFGRLQEAIAPFAETLFAGLEWAWYNILVPLASWVIEDYLPAWLDHLSGALEFLNGALGLFQPLAIWLWDDFLQPLAEWSGGAIIDRLSELTDLLRDLSDLLSGETSFGEFISNLSPAQTAMAGIASSIAAISISLGVIAAQDALKSLSTFFNSVMNLTASGAIGKLAEMIAIVASGAGSLAEAMEFVFGTVATTIAGIAAIIGGAVLAATNFFAMLSNGFSWVNEALMVVGVAISAVGAVILGAPAIVAGVVAAVVATVATAVVLITTYGDSIKTALDQFSNWLQNIFCRDWTEVFGVKLGTLLNFFVGVVGGALGGLKEMFFGLIDIIQGVFTGNWEQAFDGLVGIAKGAVNGIIGIINGMIRAVADGINSIIKAVNKLSFTVPDWDIFGGLAGKKFGFNLKTVSYPQIPYLAKGAVLPANKPFLAMVGDQRHGTNIEAPLSTIQEAVALVMEDMTGGMMAGFEANQAVLQAILEAIYDIDTSDERYAKAVDAFNRKMAVVRGG